MLFVKNDSMDAKEQFAQELYLFNELDIDTEFFMFWRTKPTLMIGRFQNAYEEINSEFVKNNNIEVVRRISGGGTIYTDECGWQFSFINKNVKGNEIDFSKYTKPIINALDEMGINASLSGRNDLLIDNKKFSGNAMYRRKNKMIHHGSLLFDTNIENLVKSLTVNDDKIISKGIKSVRERVCNINDYLQEKITSLQFSDVMLENLLRAVDDIYELTEYDIKRIDEIKKEKFDNWEWNYGKNPEFNIHKKNRYKGGKVETKLNVKEGDIKSISIYGDFFAKKDIKELEKLLIGCKYQENALLSLLELNNAQDYIQDISISDLLCSLI